MTVLSPLSTQPVRYQGDFVVGAKVQTFDAGTLNPRAAFSDAAGTTALSQPFFSDSNGCVPVFYVTGVTKYRVRILSTAGVVIRDIDGIAADVDTSSSGGGTTPVTGALLTGDVIWRPVAGIIAGRVRANGRSIGNAVSGASERANADTSALFQHLWNSNPYLNVSGSRGVDAATDFAANKSIDLPDMRGRAPFGFDDMGGANAGRLTGALFTSGNAITVNSQGGEATHVLLTAEMPSHAHTASSASAGAHNHGGASAAAGAHNHTLTDPGHSHTYNIVLSSAANGASSVGTGNATPSTSVSTTGITIAGVGDHTHTISTDGAHTHNITVNNTGSDGAHNNLPPFMVGTFYIQL